MRRRIVALLALPIAVACSSAGTQSNGDRSAGAEIYRTNCATCHGPTGVEGGVVGPSLRHESRRMDYGATISWIEDPQPPMPRLYPEFLTEKQVRDLAAYVNAL
ncbi:MAG: cytochrome c [Candidatus Eremiobacteraeota bacterium]|nr:cytochrome c [Candidatus Eremiobacteraeota bacterium]MBV8498462.1 cytochrome c [Candidatus Eremiobacteraeota bacterium]